MSQLSLWAVMALQTLLSGSAPTLVERETWVMGTRFHVVIEGAEQTSGQDLGERIVREVERVDALLSTWDPATPLSRLNRTPLGVWADVEPELADLLAETDEWARLTQGAFEARIGSLVDAWDLRGLGRVPEASLITAALEASGAGSMDGRDGQLRRTYASSWIDSGAFGKGAALRTARALIAEAEPDRSDRALLDLGGQVLALAPREEPWTIEVAHPFRRDQAAATLSVYDRSVATSGTSERGEHILDPRTGFPVEPWGSVTVLHADPLVADILSTALFVMGPVDGFAWARRAGVAALFLEPNDAGIATSWTKALEPWLHETSASPQDLSHPSGTPS